jgi:hypothetical protein
MGGIYVSNIKHSNSIAHTTLRVCAVKTFGIIQVLFIHQLML